MWICYCTTCKEEMVGYDKKEASMMEGKEHLEENPDHVVILGEELRNFPSEIPTRKSLLAEKFWTSICRFIIVDNGNCQVGEDAGDDPNHAYDKAKKIAHLIKKEVSIYDRVNDEIIYGGIKG